MTNSPLQQSQKAALADLTASETPTASIEDSVIVSHNQKPKKIELRRHSRSV